MTLDGRLSRTDGAVLITVFAAWLGTTVLQAIKERDNTAEVLGEHTPGKAASFGGYRPQAVP